MSAMNVMELVKAVNFLFVVGEGIRIAFCSVVSTIRSELALRDEPSTDVVIPVRIIFFGHVFS
jgi:hypothetical protein